MSRRIHRKLWLFAGLLLWVMLVRTISGCSAADDRDDKVRDLEFTVIGEAEVPEELRSLIAEKKERPFKLTYSDNANLFIVIGYGPQETGGYSIAVEELYITENVIVIDTELLGPEKGEAAAPETSYPYIVIKTEYLENPVVFE